jgi:hypothetical protein
MIVNRLPAEQFMLNHRPSGANDCAYGAAQYLFAVKINFGEWHCGVTQQAQGL